MSASAAQISANQTNAKKSTGPTTEIGKNMVANNAIKHGRWKSWKRSGATGMVVS